MIQWPLSWTLTFALQPCLLVAYQMCIQKGSAHGIFVLQRLLHTNMHTHRAYDTYKHMHTHRAYETYKHAHTQRAYDTYKHMYTHTELRTGSGVSHATCITATTLDFSLLEVVAVLSFKEGLCCSGPGPEHQALIHANLASHTFALVPALKSNWKWCSLKMYV